MTNDALETLLAVCRKDREKEMEAHLVGLVNDPGSGPTLADAFKTHGAPLWEGDWLNEILASALLKTGKTGLNLAGQMLVQDIGPKKTGVLLRHLWRLYSPEEFGGPVSFSDIPRTLVPDRTAENRAAASEVLRRFFAATLSDPMKFGHLALFMHSFQMFCIVPGKPEQSDEAANAFARDFLQMIATTSLRISDETIEQYAQLLKNAAKEEALQVFFEKHPVFWIRLPNP